MRANDPGRVGAHHRDRVGAVLVRALGRSGVEPCRPPSSPAPTRRGSGACAVAARSAPSSTARVRSTRSATSCSFHEPHADGPVASESASVRACSSSSVADVADGVGDLADRRRVGQVAAHGDVGQQQVVLHEPHEDRRRRSAGARAAGRSRATSAIPLARVIAGVALAEVVEQRPEHEEVGPIDAAGEGGGVGGRLPQVPVDGEAVVGVALRPAAHGAHSGQQAHEDAPLVERLEHVDRPVPLAEQGDQLVERPVGPALAATRRRRRRRPAGRASSGRGGPRAGRRRAPPAARAPGRRPDRPVPVSSISRSTTTSPSPTRSSWPTWCRDAWRHAPVGDPRDPPCRGGDVGHQHVGGLRRRTPAATASWSSRRSTSPGRPVARCRATRTATSVLLALRRARLVVGRHEQVGVAGPPQRVDVAEPAVAVLQVGLEQVGDVAGLRPALDHPRAQGVEPAASVAAVLRQPLRRQAGAELVVAGERAGAEQRRRRVQVVGGEGQLLVERAHGVAELEPGVPQRVPQRRGDLVDAARPAVVDEQDVDVALRGQLAGARTRRRRRA